ncbi:hypothetical protein P9112_004719 [Eukaryota sp. TZLM1-RC]
MYGSLKNPQVHSVYMVLNWKQPSRDDASPKRCLSDHLTYQLDKELVSDLDFNKDYSKATNDFFNRFNVHVQFHIHPLCRNPVNGIFPINWVTTKRMYVKLNMDIETIEEVIRSFTIVLIEI